MPYEIFAKYYDSLMHNVQYSSLADYVSTLIEKFGDKNGITLDLACGTGTLTVELAKRGYDIYGIDASEDMLSIAYETAAENELSILFLCQKMQNLDLYGTIDNCVCCMDSINHITDKNELQTAFNKISLFMNKGGCLVFDCNTEYKHRKILGNNTFVYENNEVFCVWQNTLLSDNATVKINLDFFEKSKKDAYIRSSEEFCEKAYSVCELKEMLNSAGFSVEQIYAERTFLPAKDNEQRLFFVCKKI